jgi:hypothetical protein
MAQDFLLTYAPLANDIAQRTGLDPSVVLGIVDTETGGGTRVAGNNVFGISPVDKTGRQYVEKYPDVETAAEAFVTLMQTPRYRAIAAAGGPAQQAVALVKAGYNTVNPRYAEIVANKATRYGQMLGYQDEGQGGAQPGATPVAAAAAPAPDYNNPPVRPVAPPVAPAPAPAGTGSAVDRVLADPALSGTPATTPAPAAAGAKPQTAVDRVLADPALQTPATAAPVATPAAAPVDPRVPQGEVPSRIRDAAYQAFINAPSRGTEPGNMSVLSTGTQNWLSNNLGPIGEYGINLPARFAGTVIGGVAAAGAAGIQTVNELAREAGTPPALQRDLNILAMASPGMGAEMTALSALRQPGALSLPSTKQAQLADRNVRIAMDRTPGGPDGGGGGGGGGGPQPGMGPRSAGAAATPAYEAIHTPQEEAAYRATAEGKKLLEPQIIGERDMNQYIPGETVNAAEREQTVKVARELKELGIRVPEASQIEKEIAQSVDTARTIYAENTAKSPNDIHNRTVRRETDINNDKAVVFAPDNVTGAPDFGPVLEHMRAVLDDPFNRQNSALKQAYEPLMKRIEAANIDNPMEAWSLRRDIDKMTSKRAQSDDRYLHEVAHDLDQVAAVIDRQIEAVAPGYGDMLARYKEHSRAITEMEVLQGVFKNLRGTGQKLTYNAFQRFMKDVVNGRMSPAHDMNGFKAISAENMQRLWNLRDSLRRSASAKELAMAAGSDTMPNIIDALKAVGKMGGTAALHAYAGAHLGPAGNFALQGLATIGKGLNDRRMIRRATTQMHQMMRPSEPLRLPPGQENALAP